MDISTLTLDKQVKTSVLAGRARILSIFLFSKYGNNFVRKIRVIAILTLIRRFASPFYTNRKLSFLTEETDIAFEDCEVKIEYHFTFLLEYVCTVLSVSQDHSQFFSGESLYLFG
jgi:hypothetical protein